MLGTQIRVAHLFAQGRHMEFIAYACRPYDAFSDERLIEADKLIKRPAEIDARIGAAIMVKI